MLSQKEIVQILKDVFYAKKVNRHGESRKMVFDKDKLDKMGKIFDLSIDVEVRTEEGYDALKGKNGTFVIKSLYGTCFLSNRPVKLRRLCSESCTNFMNFPLVGSTNLTYLRCFFL